MKILVLGAGSWGTTLACLLHGNGHMISVWEYDPAVVEQILRSREHPRLPKLAIPTEIVFHHDMTALRAEFGAVICVVPAVHVRETCRSLAGQHLGESLFVVCAKGIENNTLALLSDVVADEMGATSTGRIGVLSGPSHAEEVSRGVPTAVTASSIKIQVAEQIRDLFMAPAFRVYTQTDMVGVELAAALKNVIAIACGVNDGLGFGDNSKAALITRGLSEITRLGMKMGARQETFYGLAGIGDLVVTCMSGHSRNRNFGYYLGQGMSAEEALDRVGMVVEGYYTVQAAVALAAAHGVEMPITEAVGAVIYQGVKPLEAVSALMTRDPKSEMEG